ncbi:MAG: hypothetical protein CM1200mP1_16800 [Candidatus Neomarinimicrobiota bacterium]|nr:MAG: hypothetical protein CM1200mP1_16800 [Candidatus Neomarinimicrobiota bacterium]
MCLIIALAVPFALNLVGGFDQMIEILPSIILKPWVIYQFGLL